MKKTIIDPAPQAENAMRERIITAAFDAFVEKGYSGTSTLEISTRAKVSKRDLYANFPSKRAILLNCLTNRAARMRLPPDLPAPRSREMLATTLTEFGATVLRELSHPSAIAMLRLAIAEAEQSPEVAKALNDSRAGHRKVIAELLAGAQAEGILGAGEPLQMMEQFFSLVWGDLMLGRLLGLARIPKPAEIRARAQAAADALMKIYPH